MGLNDPRQRDAMRDGWDGLTRLLRQPAPTLVAPRAVSSRSVAAPLPPSRKPQISAAEWLSQIDGFGQDIPDQMLAFLASCDGLPVSWSARDVLILKIAVGNRTLHVLGFERSGAVHIPWWIGDAKAAFRGFAEDVASVLPGAVAYETPKTWTVRHAGKRPIHVQELLLAAKAVKDALARLEADLKTMLPSS